MNRLPRRLELHVSGVESTGVRLSGEAVDFTYLFFHEARDQGEDDFVHVFFVKQNSVLLFVYLNFPVFRTGSPRRILLDMFVFRTVGWTSLRKSTMISPRYLCNLPVLADCTPSRIGGFSCPDPRHHLERAKLCAVLSKLHLREIVLILKFEKKILYT